MKQILIALLLTLSGQMVGQNMQDICPLKVGAEIPDSLSLTDMLGKTLTLKDIISDKPTVLMFYRGGWCGYCTKQLSGLKDARSSIDSLGFQLIAVSPDYFDQLDKSMAKTELDYPLYSDHTAQLISAFGLSWKLDDEKYKKYKTDYEIDLEAWSQDTHHLLPVPAVYIIKEGKVQFHYVNPDYSTRLQPATLLAILATL